QARSDRVDQDMGGLESRQVWIPGKVLQQLTNFHVVASPQGYTVKLHSKTCASQRSNQELFRPQFLARTWGKRILTGKAKGLPCSLGLRILPNWDEQPLIRFRKPCIDRTIGRPKLGFRLLHLVG